jgi:hypothetical protein
VKFIAPSKKNFKSLFIQLAGVECNSKSTDATEWDISDITTVVIPTTSIIKANKHVYYDPLLNLFIYSEFLTQSPILTAVSSKNDDSTKDLVTPEITTLIIDENEIGSQSLLETTK